MNNTCCNKIPITQRVEAAVRMSQRGLTGETVQKISDETGIGRTRLYELEKAYNEGRSLEDGARPGRPKKVTPQIEARVLRSLRNDPFQPSKQVKTSINTGLEENIQISDRTIRRIATSHGLHSRRAAFKTFLTSDQKIRRLEFGKKYLDSDIRFWGHIIFSDETKVELFPRDGRQRVRRPLNKRFHPRYLAHHSKGKGPSLMFWGCISYKGQGKLFKILGTLNGESYARILSLCIPDMIAQQKIRAPILQEDNSRIHTSNIAQQKKEELQIKTLEWPSYSPDLNPIEGIWSYWKDRVRRSLPQNVAHLERICIQEWGKIPPSVIQAHIASLPKRLAALVKANGGHIKY